MPLKKEGKIFSVQYLRGLAALGVVFCHYGSNLILYPRLSTFFNFGQTGVHVFFLISGFIIVYSLVKAGYKTNQFFRFLLKRSIRIDPSYICVILLTIIFFSTLSISKNEAVKFSVGQFLAHIFYLVPFTHYRFYNNVFWTLCVEFQFYLIVGLLYFLSENRLYQYALLIAFSLTCFIPFSNSYYLVTNYAPIFALGISLVPLYSKKSLLGIVLSAFILCLIGYKLGLPLLCLLTSSCFVILFFKYLIRPLIFLGDISYSLYLTHGLTLILFVGFGKKAQFDFNHYQLFWLFLEVVVAVVFAYLFYMLIERPSLKLSKRVFYKHPAPVKG